MPVTPGHTDDDPEDPNGHLTVVKANKGEAPEGGYKLGDTVSYTVTVKNDGNLTITDVTVTDERTGLTETIASLAPGAEQTFETSTTVTEADILSGHIINDATATGTSPDPENPDVPVTPGHTDDDPEDLDTTLTVNKTISNEPADGEAYKLGETIEYTITVTNDGNVTYENVKVTDELTGDEWTIESLGVGETKTLTTSHVVTEADILAGEVANTVTAKADPIDDPKDPENPKTPEGEDTVTTADEGDPDGPTPPIVEPNGHLTVTKVTTSTPANGETYALDETIAYKVTVTNDGNLTITDITVTDELTGDEWTVASLKPGVSATFKTSYTVTEADILAGEVVNVATAKGTSPDPDEPDVPVVPGTDPEPTDEPDGHLTVTKVTTSTAKAEDGKYALGEEITYKITVANDSNLTITDITVTDELTGDEWTIDSLAPGASKDFEASYTVTEADVLAGEVVNVATAKGTSPDPDQPDVPVVPGTDPEPTEEKDGHVTVTKVTTSKPANGETYALGEKVTYKITVTNDGNLTITKIDVKDDLTNQGWYIDSLAPGESKDFTTSYEVTEDDILAGSVKNVATAKGTSPDPDQPDVPVDPGNTEDPTDKPAPKITSEKTSTGTMTGLDANGKPAYAEGDELTYTITVTNEGNLTATGIKVVDAKLGYTADKPFAYDGEVKPGETVTVLTGKYVVTAEDVAAGSVLNEATVTAKTDGGDPEPAPSEDEQPVEKIFTITYDPNGGNFNGSTENVVEHYKYGTVITIIGAPTRDGYTFTYWKGSEYQPGDKYTVTEDHTFVAQWEPKVEPAKPEPKPEPKKPVKTGDDTNLTPLYMTMEASATLFLALAAYTLHRRRHEDDAA